LRGAVVDFIDFQWFPIFNVADMGVTIGGGLLVLASWQAGRQSESIDASGEHAHDGPDDTSASGTMSS
jgi:signal peptidase II